MNGGLNALKTLVEVGALALGVLMVVSSAAVAVYFRKDIIRAERKRARLKLGLDKVPSVVESKEKEGELEAV